MKCIRTLLLMVMIAATSSASVWASTIGLDILGGGAAGFDTRDMTIGWSFSVLAPIRVTSLGYWDEGGNGLVDAHDVGLWTSDGDLVAQATVTDASPTTVTSVSGLGSWQFQPLASPLVLNAGEYVLGGFYPGNSQDFFRFVGTSVATDPLVTFTGVRDGTFAPTHFPSSSTHRTAHTSVPTSSSRAPLSLNPHRSCCWAPASSVSASAVGGSDEM